MSPGYLISHKTQQSGFAPLASLSPLVGETAVANFFARIESMNLNAVAVFAIASVCRAEAPLRGVPPLFKMPLRPAKIIRRNRKRSALQPASKDNGRSSKHTARLRFMGRVRERENR